MCPRWKKRVLIPLALSCVAMMTAPVYADMMQDLASIEEQFGMDYSDMKVIDRVTELEDQMGIVPDINASVADRIDVLMDEFGLSKNKNSSTTEAASAQNKIECDGYDTPEEAAMAYMTAFANHDLDGMISSFAIESYAKNYHLDEQIERNAVYVSTMIIATPALDDYASKVRIRERVSYIEKNLATQYRYYAMAAAGIEYDNTSIMLEDRTGEELLNEIYASPVWAMAEIQNIKVMRPEEFPYTSEHYFDESNQKYLQEVPRVQGAEDSQELIVEFTVDGMTGYQCLSLGKYDGRWYVRDLNTSMGAVMGANVNLFGLLFPVMVEDLEH